MRFTWFSQLFTRQRPSSPASGAFADSIRPRGGNGTVSRRPLDTNGRSRHSVAESEPELIPVIPRRVSAARAAQQAAISPPPSQPPPPAPAPLAEVFVPKPVAREPTRDDEALKTTLMAPQEELALKVSEGLKSLTTLLAAIDDRLVHQQRATELVADRLQALPRVLEGLVDAERLNLETLKDLRGSMERQGQASLSAAEKLDKLPGLMDGLASRVERQTEASTSVKTSVEAVGQSVRGMADGNQRATTQLVNEFRRGQDAQKQQFDALLERQRKLLWFVAGFGAMVVLVLVFVLARLAK